jgi:DNA-binding response OmpR family regulator
MSCDGRNLKILVVDDDRGICETLNDIMTDLGFNVVIANAEWRRNLFTD